MSRCKCEIIAPLNNARMWDWYFVLEFFRVHVERESDVKKKEFSPPELYVFYLKVLQKTKDGNRLFCSVFFSFLFSFLSNEKTFAISLSNTHKEGVWGEGESKAFQASPDISLTLTTKNYYVSLSIYLSLFPWWSLFEAAAEKKFGMQRSKIQDYRMNRNPLFQTYFEKYISIFCLLNLWRVTVKHLWNIFIWSSETLYLATKSENMSLFTFSLF